MDVEVDGHAYTLRNGGELRIWPGSNPGNASNNFVWHPFGAAIQLPKGQVLYVIPASPEGSIKAAFRAARHLEPNVRSPEEFLPFLNVEYPATAVPIVYIFDRGDEPKYVEGYSMRAALLDGDTRVKARGQRAKRVLSDVRISSASLLPLIRPMEELSPILAETAESATTPVPSAAYDEWLHKWKSLYLRRDGRLFISPRLAGYSVVLRGARGTEPFVGAGPKFNSLNVALSQGQSATVWLRPLGESSDKSFDKADDPRVAIFRAEWAASGKNPYRDLATGGAVSISGVEFQRGARGRVSAVDGSIKMIDGLQAFLGNPFNGEAQGIRGDDRGDWHSVLSPTTAGFPASKGTRP